MRRGLIVGIVFCLMISCVSAGLYGWEIYMSPEGCTDSDGGNDIFNVGFITFGEDSYVDECQCNNAPGSWLPCSEGTHLIEYYCENNEVKHSERIECPSGCALNACKRCNDSDGGKNYYVKGNIRYHASPTSTQGSFDYCQPSGSPREGTLTEGYCENGVEKYVDYECPSGCLDGVCVVEEQEGSCVDTDGGKDYYAKGKTYYINQPNSDSNDVCIRDTLYEQYCTLEGTHSNVGYECPNGCKNGACIEDEDNKDDKDIEDNEIPISITALVCTDSDGGLEFYKKGSSVVKREGQLSKAGFEDTCLKDLGEIGEELHFAMGNIEESDKGNKNVLLEAECLGISVEELEKEIDNFDVAKLVTKHICPQGCQDGACTGGPLYKNCPQLEKPTCPRGSELKSEEDENDCVTRYRCERKLSNGRNSEIKIMPETASERARERLGELEFEIELKEVGKEENAKAVYEVKANKSGRFLGLFKLRGEVLVNVDSETGEIMFVKKPWWAFLALGI